MSRGYIAHLWEKWQRAMHSYLSLIVLLGTCAAFLGGCLIPSQESLKKNSWPVQGTSVPADAQATVPDQPLVKPVIPPETPSATETDSVRPEATGQEESQKTAASPQPTPPTAAARPEPAKEAKLTSEQAKLEGNSQGKQWEDEKIKSLALDLAKNSAAVIRVKVCYSVKNDEWWIVAYEDTGEPIELKQYIWNREQHRLEPFLVIKTISRDRLEEHLRTPEPDKACEVVPLPPKEPSQPEKAS